MVHATGTDRSLSAADARELSKQTTRIVEEQLADIFPRIRCAASTGRTFVAVPRLRGSAPEQQKVTEALMELGYTVRQEHDQQERMSWTKVSWSD